jgi:hypothetical protein
MARINSSGLITGLRINAVKGRLARAHLAGELDETLPLADAVKQMIDRFAVFRAVKKKSRVRRDVKRRLSQTIIIQVHARL